MSMRRAGIVGVAACVIFWAALLVLGAVRPVYSQWTNNISELGAIGTPNAIVWNIIGFVIPGAGLAIVGRGLGIAIDAGATRSGRLAVWLLPLFGLGVAGQGFFPALMTNGAPILTSWHTRAHLVVSVLGGIPWIAALLILIAPMRRNAEWRGLYAANVAAVMLVIVGSLTRGCGLPDGLVERIVGGVVFLWFLLMSIRLIQVSTRKDVSIAVPE